MDENSKKLYNPDEVEMKMPEENFFGADTEEKSKSLLPIILVIIILILLAFLVALLLWSFQIIQIPGLESFSTSAETETESLEETVLSDTEPKPVAEVPEPEPVVIDVDIYEPELIERSDEIEAIEEDLLEFDLENVDFEIKQILEELN